MSRLSVRLALPATMLAILLGCAAPPAPEPPWQRTSLLRIEPLVQGTKPFKPTREQVLLGQGPRRTRAEGARIAGEIRALKLEVGPEMQWTIELGEEAYLSYVPLTRPREGCEVSHRVRLRPEDETWIVVDERPVPDHETFAPASVVVPLDDYAGQTVELGLKAGVEGKGCGGLRALWGNPAVFSRRSSESTAEIETSEKESTESDASKSRPNVLLLGLDTLRADALGAYGKTPSPSPTIDRLAAESHVWLEAYSAFNITNPSFSSLHTGLYGKNHGIYDLITPLPESYATLAESFSAAGWATGAVVSARHLEGSRSGLDQGFDRLISEGKQLAAEEAVDRTMRWFSERDEEKPFFFWLHLFDPHTPHTPPEPFASGERSAAPRLGPIDDWLPFRELGVHEYRDRRLGGHEALYESEVAYLDHHLGRLLDFLDSRGLLETTWIALTADHGENLGEHDVDFRHSGLWDTVTHVPLLLRPPGGIEGRRISGLVQSFDLFPTLLAVADLPVPPQDGRDLLAGETRRAVFMESAVGNGAGVRTAEHLYFFTEVDRGTVAAGRFLYDLRKDPMQEENLAGQGLDEEERLHALVERWRAERSTLETAQSQDLSAEELEQLRALGYLD